MYEELVKRLRECRNMAVLSSFWWDITTEAAEAIEDLQEKLLMAEVDLNDMAEAIEYWQGQVPKWIPVTERLPEHGVHVLAACHVKWRGGGGRYYVCDAFHTEHFTDTCSYNDDIDMEYNEEEDEYYMPEGWWEVIKNWDDYSCVAIGDFVTHWMPLPEPPKEGK